jgi:hypothetical protein
MSHLWAVPDQNASERLLRGARHHVMPVFRGFAGYGVRRGTPFLSRLWLRTELERLSGISEALRLSQIALKESPSRSGYPGKPRRILQAVPAVPESLKKISGPFRLPRKASEDSPGRSGCLGKPRRILQAVPAVPESLGGFARPLRLTLRALEISSGRSGSPGRRRRILRRHRFAAGQ